MRFTHVDLIRHHITAIRLSAIVTPAQDTRHTLGRFLDDGDLIGVERYSASGQEHLLVCEIDYDPLSETGEDILISFQLHANDVLGLGALGAPSRPGEALPALLELSSDVEADTAVDMGFELARDAGEVPPFFPLPRPVDSTSAPLDVLTGIRGVKHREGTGEREYTAILDRTDDEVTMLSLEIPWRAPFGADTLTRIAERASGIATALGLPEPDAARPQTDLLRPRPRRHKH